MCAQKTKLCKSSPLWHHKRHGYHSQVRDKTSEQLFLPSSETHSGPSWLNPRWKRGLILLFSGDLKCLAYLNGEWCKTAQRQRPKYIYHDNNIHHSDCTHECRQAKIPSLVCRCKTIFFFIFFIFLFNLWTIPLSHSITRLQRRDFLNSKCSQTEVFFLIGLVVVEQWRGWSLALSSPRLRITLSPELLEKKQPKKTSAPLSALTRPCLLSPERCRLTSTSRPLPLRSIPNSDELLSLRPHIYVAHTQSLPSSVTVSQWLIKHRNDCVLVSPWPSLPPAYHCPPKTGARPPRRVVDSVVGITP